MNYHSILLKFQALSKGGSLLNSVTEFFNRNTCYVRIGMARPDKFVVTGGVHVGFVLGQVLSNALALILRRWGPLDWMLCGGKALRIYLGKNVRSTI